MVRPDFNQRIAQLSEKIIVLKIFLGVVHRTKYLLGLIGSVMSKKSNLWQSILLATSLSTQVFLIAPIYILITNYSEFSISIFELGKLIFPLTLAAITVLFFFIYFFKRKNMTLIPSILLAVGIYLYFQFYFFVWDYGIFDGSAILWSDKNNVLLIEVPAIILLILFAVYSSKRRKLFSYGLILLAVLFFGETFITALKCTQHDHDISLLKTNSPKNSAKLDYFHAGEKRLALANMLSKEKNVIIILIDTLQSDIFEKIIKKHQALKNEFKGFVFYRNSAGVFPYTTLTIPALLTGSPYKPGENVDEYRARVSKQRIDYVLQEKGLTVSAIPLHSRVKYLNPHFQRKIEIVSLFDIVIFRHMPHILKPLVFNKHKFLLKPLFLTKSHVLEPEIDLTVFESLIKNSVVGDNGAHFKFLHFWGMHPPAMVDCNCEPREATHQREAVEEQGECMIKQVGRYLQRIKELGVYDQSLIILVADTGSKYSISPQVEGGGNNEIPEFVRSSAHPVIAIKDFDKQGEFHISDVPVSLLDIAPTVLSSLGYYKTDTEGFDIFSINLNQNRSRRFFYYKGAEEARLKVIPQMQEFIIRGFIRNKSSWEIGRQYFSREKNEQTTMSFVDFGEPEASKFQDLGWSVEARKYSFSWTIAGRAALIGKLPQKDFIRMIVKFSNPHPDQKVEVRLNGRTVATWKIDKPHSLREYVTKMKLSDSERDNINRVDFIIAKKGVLSDRDSRVLGICVDWVKFE